jgi:hypothetical protein
MWASMNSESHSKRSTQQIALATVLLALLPSWAAAVGAQPRVAVFPALLGPSVQNPSDYGLDPQDLVRATEETLRATRRFSLYERDQEIMEKSIEAEQAFALSEKSIEEGAEFGKLHTVELIVQPFVQKFIWTADLTPVSGVPGRFKRSDRGELEVVFKVLDTTTGTLKYQITKKANHRRTKGIVTGKGGAPSASAWNSLVEEIATAGGAAIVGAVFPVKVGAYREGELFLNRGEGGGIHVGEIWEVYSAGESIVDPDTGEELGATETPIGRAEIVRVTPKFSVARPLEQLNQEPRTGDVLRPIQGEERR